MRTTHVIAIISVLFLASSAVFPGVAEAQLEDVHGLGLAPELDLDDHADVEMWTAPPPAPGSPGDVGRWTEIIDGEEPAVSINVLRDGRVLYWSGVDSSHTHGTGSGNGEIDQEALFFLSHPHGAEARVLDLDGPEPVVQATAGLDADERDLFCAAHLTLPDGRVLALGGTEYHEVHGPGEPPGVGTGYSTYFDPATNEFTAGDDMIHHRWYPTVLQLPDGDVLVTTGIHGQQESEIIEAVERLDPETGTFSEVGRWNLPMYARQFLVPSGPRKGEVFYAAVGDLWGPTGYDAENEALWGLHQSYDPDTGEVELHAPAILGARNHAGSVLLPLAPEDGYRGEVLTFGGSPSLSSVAVQATERIDISASTPAPSLAAPMAHPRWFSSPVLLPDGTVLAVGGDRYDTVLAYGMPPAHVMAPEIYDPATDSWRSMADMSIGRGYHSSAVLLPDGRVLTGGTVSMPHVSQTLRESHEVFAQIYERRFEIFEPPYLHWGSRPVVHTSPSTLVHGEDGFLVAAGVVDASSGEPGIDSIVLVKPASATHVTDFQQRIVELEHTVHETQGTRARIQITAPPDAAVAPPGDYMLVVNRTSPSGPIPSEAAWLHVGPGPGDVIVQSAAEEPSPNPSGVSDPIKMIGAVQARQLPATGGGVAIVAPLLALGLAVLRPRWIPVRNPPR